MKKDLQKIATPSNLEAGAYAAHDLNVKLTIESLDEDGRVLLKISNAALSKLPDDNLPERISLIPEEHVSAAAIEDSIERLAGECITGQTIPAAFQQFLLRQPPQVMDLERGTSLTRPDEEPVDLFSTGLVSWRC